VPKSYAPAIAGDEGVLADSSLAQWVGLLNSGYCEWKKRIHLCQGDGVNSATSGRNEMQCLGSAGLKGQAKARVPICAQVYLARADLDQTAIVELQESVKTNNGQSQVVYPSRMHPL